MMLVLFHLLLLTDRFSGSHQSEEATDELVIHMPGVVTSSPEMYLCTPLQEVISDKERYITRFAPSGASKEHVHHMLLYGCSSPGTQEPVWLCGHDGSQGQGGFSHGGVCQGNQRILYAWARDAPPLDLPQGVGFTVGGNTGINTLVIQVHYAVARPDPDSTGVKMSLSQVPPLKHAGVMMLGSGQPIKAKATSYLDMSCPVTEDVTLHPFGFRTHAHNLSPVISGYRVRNKEWTLIGKMDPHKPQMFYPVAQEMEIKTGDTVAARCTMVNTRDHVVYMGMTNQDEMCNFYMMYWTMGPLLSERACWQQASWKELGKPPRNMSEFEGTYYPEGELS